MSLRRRWARITYRCSLTTCHSTYTTTANSKHGSGECDGNVQQLCVSQHVDSQKEWWQFIQCQNFESLSR